MDVIRWVNKHIDEMAEPRGRTKVILALAERLGISKPTLHTRLRGETKFSSEEIQKMAEYFGVEPLPKRRETGNVVQLRPTTQPDNESAEYPILGEARPGSFIEPDMLAQGEAGSVIARRIAAYPQARTMAWIAKGDSMEGAYIHDGMVVYGVDFQDAGGVLANNMIVVVEQNRGGLVERSIKEVVVLSDHVEFRPMSKNPLYRSISSATSDVKVLTVIHGGIRLMPH